VCRLFFLGVYGGNTKMTKDEDRADRLFSDMQSICGEREIIKRIIAYADEIRAEAAERVKKLRTACITDCPSYYESGFRDGCNNAIAAITGKEPTE